MSAVIDITADELADRIRVAALPGGPLYADLGPDVLGIIERAVEIDPAAQEALALERLGAPGSHINLVVQTDMNAVNFVRFRLDLPFFKAVLRRQALCIAEDFDSQTSDIERDPVVVRDDSREPASWWLGRGSSPSQCSMYVNQHYIWFDFVAGDATMVNTAQVEIHQLIRMAAGLECDMEGDFINSHMDHVGGAVVCSHIETADRLHASVRKRCPDIRAHEAAILMSRRIAAADAQPEVKSKRRRSLGV